MVTMKFRRLVVVLGQQVIEPASGLEDMVVRADADLRAPARES
jgi:hypothetical protein